MNMPTMEEIRQRVLDVAALPGWSINRLACESGVEQGSLSRFSRGRDIQKSLSYTTLERLWPFLYGDRHPAPVAQVVPHFIRDTPSERTITCTSCNTTIHDAILTSPAGRDFVDVHSRCPDPYPAMRKGQPAEAGVEA